MAEQKYVGYIGSYTHGRMKGITVCDVDIEQGVMIPREEVEVENASYLCISHSGKYLYSVADLGINAYEIMEDGSLRFINRGSINGMRACYINIDTTDKYLFTAGYHDGKASVVKLRSDGGVGKLTDEVFHKGMGSIAERNFRPHITCFRLTPDQKFVLACDMGIDQVKVYGFDYKRGKIKLVDILRCELESAPRNIIFSPDGKFAYLICQLKNYISVYNYSVDEESGMPKFELVENVTTLGKEYNNKSAVAAIKMSADGKYVFATNAGDNSVAFYDRDEKTGKLTLRSVLPISGDYPKGICLFPDGKHIASLNHNTGTVTFFTIDYEKGILVMHGKPIDIETPNSAIIHPLGE